MIHHMLLSLLDIVFPVAGILFLPALFTFSYFVDNREYGTCDEEKIYELAKFSDCSEFEIFCLAGVKWHICRQGVERDFNNYIMQGQLPFYVRDHLRNLPAGKNI